MCAFVTRTGSSVMRCGCKGVRTCRICESEKNGSNHQMVEELFTRLEFCATCSLAYLHDSQLKAHCVNHKQGFRLDGVTVVNDFISEHEEMELIRKIDDSPWVLSQSGRCKQDYGVKVNFKKRKLNFKFFTGLPAYSRHLVERLHIVMRETNKKFATFYPVELCNLEYLPEKGSSIVPHLDDAWLWGERLVLLNLGSSTYMNFTLPPCAPGYEEEWIRYKEFASTDLPQSQGVKPPRIFVPLCRRSLLIMSGKARYTWYHAINREDISKRRLSLTMRELSSEFLPPEAVIWRFAVSPPDEESLGGSQVDTLTSSQEVGKQLIEIASNFNGVCVAVTSGEPTRSTK